MITRISRNIDDLKNIIRNKTCKLLNCKRGDIATWILLAVVGVTLTLGIFNVLNDKLIGTEADPGTAYDVIDTINGVADSIAE